MAAPRRSRAGLAAAGLALALAAALAAYAAARSGAVAPFVALPGVAAVAVLVVALVFRAGFLLPVPLLLLLAEYAIFLVLEGSDRAAPLVAAALVILAELAYWGVEPRAVGRAGGVALRRAALVAIMGAGAAGVGAFLLGASGVARGGGVLLPAAGVAAAVAAVALLALLARPRAAA